MFTDLVLVASATNQYILVYNRNWLFFLSYFGLGIIFFVFCIFPLAFKSMEAVIFNWSRNCCCFWVSYSSNNACISASSIFFGGVEGTSFRKSKLLLFNFLNHVIYQKHAIQNVVFRHKIRHVQQHKICCCMKLVFMWVKEPSTCKFWFFYLQIW